MRTALRCLVRGGLLLACTAATLLATACEGAAESTDLQQGKPPYVVVREGTPRQSETVVRSEIGFRSPARLLEHFTKHGAEFGPGTAADYLYAAQRLRDARVGGTIAEITRPDGSRSRFDRATGAFLAFDADGTIRTFFKPNNGEAYFRRQSRRTR